jgi:hypothetical protein
MYIFSNRNMLVWNKLNKLLSEFWIEWKFGAAQYTFDAAQYTFGAAQYTFGAAQYTFGAAQYTFDAAQYTLTIRINGLYIYKQF